MLLAPTETMETTQDGDAGDERLPEELCDSSGLAVVWFELPSQPDYEGSSRAAHQWLDGHAPVTGRYRLRRTAGERLADVRMIKTIQTRGVQTELDLAPDAPEPAPEPAPVPAGVVDLASRRTGDGRETDGASDELEQTPPPPTEEQAAAIAKNLGSASDGESSAPAAGELDLAAKAPPDDGTILASRSVWQAAPLRKCRSLQACCFCDEPITSGMRYYDRGFGKRAHQACIDDNDAGAWASS
jgi:hypothetical protein